jgi:hypothetical protein
MNAEQALLDACSEWRRLALAGRKAIGRRDWNLFSECHAAVKKIQPLVTNLSGKWRDESGQSPEHFVANEKKIRLVVSELIELTRHNQQLLDRARKTALARREELAQAARNLKRLQLSYVSARPAAWTSFS